MIFGVYRDASGRTCPAYRPGDLREAHLNYEAMCQEEEIVETPTRTVDEEVDERTKTYMRVHAVADYGTAMQKVLDADARLKAAYTDRPVRVAAKAGPLADLGRPQDAEVEEARKRLWKRAHELSKLDPISATLQAIQENPALVAILLKGE